MRERLLALTSTEGFRKVKVLGRGKIDVPVNVTAHKFSVSAENSIEKAGGKITRI